MDKEKVLNLGLLFDDKMNVRFAKYSQYLNAKLPGPYTLGINSLPHVSVLQFLDDTKSAEETWALAKGFSETVFEVDFQGLYFDVGRSGRLWFGIRIALNDQLMDLQKNLLGVILPQTIVNGSGASYFPHVTLGCSASDSTLPAISFEPETTMLEKIPCQLALGRSGPDLQFAEIIYS